MGASENRGLLRPWRYMGVIRGWGGCQVSCYLAFSVNIFLRARMCVCIYTFIYIYIYICLDIHTHAGNTEGDPQKEDF